MLVARSSYKRIVSTLVAPESLVSRRCAACANPQLSALQCTTLLYSRRLASTSVLPSSLNPHSSPQQYTEVSTGSSSTPSTHIGSDAVLPARRVSLSISASRKGSDSGTVLPKVSFHSLTRHSQLRTVLRQCLGDALSSHGKDPASSLAGGEHSGTSNLSSLSSLAHVSSKLQIRRFETTSERRIEWLDISCHPTAALEEYRDAIASALVHLGAHETLVEATLEGVLLPQTTLIEGCQCMVVRCAVEDTSYDMDSIQELTNRLTILVFEKESRIVTVHRTMVPGISNLMKRWREEQCEDGAASSMHNLALYLVKEASRSFHRALAKSIVQFDNYEANLFAPQRGRSQLARQIYHIKRRASVYSRILALTQEAFHHFLEALRISSSNVYVQDVLQDLAHVRSLSDELNDNANSVLQLLFQLSSYQLNELMRVLTMFSAFFIPLGFIASVYGMNFENLPGLNDPNGHWYCLTLMLAVGLSIVFWFKWKRFW